MPKAWPVLASALNDQLGWWLVLYCVNALDVLCVLIEFSTMHERSAETKA
jgi:hypothetical protein